MIKKIIEAPFKCVGWLFTNVYGRIVSVLVVTVFACMVNFPIEDREVGVWEVEDVLKDSYSKEEGPPTDVDRVGKLDKTAIESRKVIRRVELKDTLAYITLPFHHVAERQVTRISETWDETRKHKIVRRQVLWISRGLTLGLDLRGGTELVYRIVAPKDPGKEQSVKAEDVAEVIRRRVDAYGLREPRIQPVGGNRVLVQIPGFDASDVARVRSIITRIGRLEFRLVADDQINKVQLDELRNTGKAPRGWHKYTLVQESKEDPGKMTSEDVLIDDETKLMGDAIERVDVGPGGKSGAEITVHLTFVDRDAFWRVTADNVGRRLAIVLDDVRDKDNNLVQLGRVHSAPRIENQILGPAEIIGGFTRKTADDLKYVLQSGSLKAPLEMESEQFVGPCQGKQAIEDGQKSAIIGFIAVFAFMLVYYLKAGLVANFALLLNVALLIAALALRGATLTLPGIAGIVLTIGMAVDANVLIFERIREEMRKMADKPLIKCFRDGHSRAMSAIIDSNLTTVIVAVILYQFGTGPVKGFAVTLSYGIIISMFTAVVVCRLVFEAMFAANLLKTMPMMQMIPMEMHVPFLAMRKFWIATSTVVIALLVVSMVAIKPLKLGIDFSSGTLVQVNLKQKVSAEVIRKEMEKAGYKDTEVQERGLTDSGGSKTFSVRMRYVPVPPVESASKVDPAKYPAFAGGAKVVVKCDRQVTTTEMARRLAELKPAKYAIEEGPKSGNFFTYIIRNDDKTPDNVADLEANAKSIFGSESVIGDIRKALAKSGPGGGSLLVDEGIQPLSDSDGNQRVQIAFKDPVKPEVLTKALGMPSAAVKAVELDAKGTAKPANLAPDGTAEVFVVTAQSLDLPKIKDVLKTANLSTLEPFGSVEKIAPSVAVELTAKAAVAVVLSWLAIIAYVWFRFEFRYGLGGVIALVHDVLIVLGALALTGREIDMTAIAALLTIIGYSINDTIVVFDRIRENRRTVRKMTMAEIVDHSINQTLSRTILTSFTTFLAVLALYIWGGPAIDTFAFAMLVGIVVGTYSSIFIASPILLLMGEQGAMRGPLTVTSTRTVRPLEGFNPTA